jgi:hypothetical protein
MPTAFPAGCVSDKQAGYGGTELGEILQVLLIALFQHIREGVRGLIGRRAQAVSEAAMWKNSEKQENTALTSSLPSRCL